MTKPTIVFFGYDTVPNLTPKVFLRTLLYSSASRGHVVEGMFVKLLHEGTEQVFSFWGYGQTDNLTAGSGIHVGKEGISANHHFVLSVHEKKYSFKSGNYAIEIFANIANRKSPIHLSTINLFLTKELSEQLKSHKGILFERNVFHEYKGHAR